MRTRGRLAFRVSRSWRTARGIVSASGALQLQPVVLDRGEAVAGRPGRRAAGGLVEGGGDPVEKDLRIGRQSRWRYASTRLSCQRRSS